MPCNALRNRVPIDPGETNVVAEFPVRLTAALQVEVVATPATGGDVMASDGPFSIRVRWALPANHDNPRSGQYGVSVLAEAIGPGYEGPLGRGEPVPASRVGDEPHVATIDVPVGVLVPGVYRLVTMLSHDDPARGVATVVGFREGPCVEVRESTPAGRVDDGDRSAGATGRARIRLLACDP